MLDLQTSWISPLASDGKDRSHFPFLPLWTVIVRLAQFIVALIVLILTAIAASEFTSNVDGFGLTFFTFSWTIFYFASLGITVFLYPISYNPFVYVPFEAITNIFWLCSWAVLASDASIISDTEKAIGFRYVSTSAKNAANCVKAAAGIGALEWVLFTVTLAFLVIGTLKEHGTADAEAAGEAPRPTELQPVGPQQPSVAAGTTQPSHSGNEA